MKNPCIIRFNYSESNKERLKQDTKFTYDEENNIFKSTDGTVEVEQDAETYFVVRMIPESMNFNALSDWSNYFVTNYLKR